MTDGKFYTVNDRPVAILRTADGGEDCVVFDFATGELIPDRAYFAHVTPGSGRDVDALTEAEFEARLATCRADAGARAAAQLRDWAQRLLAADGAAAEVAAALGLTGIAVRDGSVTVDPPPPGYSAATVTAEPGRVSVKWRSAGRLLTRPILDAEFGAARELPIFPDSFDEGHLAYSVAVPGSQAVCTIYVRIRRAAASHLDLCRPDPR
jgi:hypothetical protein